MPAQPSEIDAQKAALTAAIAQQGSQGQQAYLAEEARRKAAQQAAVQQIAANAKMTGIAGPAPAEFTQSLQGQQRDLGSIYAQDAAMSQQTFNNSIANTQASNAAYMDAARAAVPVVNAQTAGTVARIRAEQEAEREARAYEERMRQQEEEFAREERNVRRLELEVRRRELANESGQPTEEELADQEAKAQGFLARIANQGVAAREIAGQVVNDVPDFKTAVEVLDSYARAYVQDNPDRAAEWNDKVKREVLRSLYNIYNVDTGMTAPKMDDKFAEALIAQGVDPRANFPGYMSPQDVVAARKEMQSGRARVFRNAQNRRAVQRAIAAEEQYAEQQRRNAPGAGFVQNLRRALPRF